MRVKNISPRCIVLPGIIAAFVEPGKKYMASVPYNTRSEADLASLLCTAECAMWRTLFCKLHVAHLALLIATWPSHLQCCHVIASYICVGRASVHDCSADCQCQPACYNEADLCLTGKKRKSRQNTPGALVTPVQV